MGYLAWEWWMGRECSQQILGRHPLSEHYTIMTLHIGIEMESKRNWSQILHKLEIPQTGGVRSWQLLVGIYTVLHSSQVTNIMSSLLCKKLIYGKCELQMYFVPLNVQNPSIKQLFLCWQSFVCGVLSSMFKSLRLTLPASSNLNSM